MLRAACLTLALVFAQGAGVAVGVILGMEHERKAYAVVPGECEIVSGPFTGIIHQTQ